MRSVSIYTARFDATIEHTWPEHQVADGAIACTHRGQTTDAMHLD